MPHSQRKSLPNETLIGLNYPETFARIESYGPTPVDFSPDEVSSRLEVNAPELGSFSQLNRGLSIFIPIAVVGGAIGLLIHFAGFLIATAITIGIIAFLAFCINRTLNDTFV